MIKIFYVQIVLLILTNYGFCQNNCDYNEYNDLITSAINEVSNKAYDQANENYRLAFSKVKTPFSLDLTSALKIAEEVKDTNHIYQIIILLAKGGIPLKHFKGYVNHAWYPQFESDFEEYAIFYKSTFNLELKTKLLSLRNQDSLFNDGFHKWRKGEMETTLDELINDAQSISDGFEKLVSNYGFPSEKRMGYNYQNGEIVRFPILIILIHIYQRGILLYKERLPQLVCEGEIPFDEEMMLETFRGFGNSTGVEQEMTIRFEKFKNKN